MAILLSVGCLGFWVPDFLAPLTGGWGALVATLLLTFVNAFFFVILIYQRGVTRKLEGLPFVLYVLAISVLPTLHTQWILQIVLLLFQLILHLVMSAYRREQAVEPAFLASLLLCVAALFLPDVLFLLPILWTIFIVQKAMSLRVFLASMVGVVLVWLYAYLFKYLGWIDGMELTEVWQRTNIDQSASFYLFNAIFTIVGLFFALMNMGHQNIENTPITVFVWSVSIAFVPCAILMFFPSAYFASLFIITLFLIITLATYFFTSRASVFAGSVFLLFIALLVSLFFVF